MAQLFDARFVPRNVRRARRVLAGREHHLRISSGSLAIFAAIRRASSRVIDRYRPVLG
jgi:hypothetical protein